MKSRKLKNYKNFEGYKTTILAELLSLQIRPSYIKILGPSYYFGNA